MDKLTASKNAWPAKVAKTNTTCLPVSKSTSADHNSFVVLDHVMFYDKHKNIFRGTVESVGPSCVGIKVVSDRCEIGMIDNLPMYFLVCRIVLFALLIFPTALIFIKMSNTFRQKYLQTFCFQFLLLDETLLGTEGYTLMMMCLVVVRGTFTY